MQGVIDLLMQTRATLENPSTPLTSANIEKILGGEPSRTGVSVSTESAISWPPVLRAIMKLARDTARLSLHTYRREGEGKQRAAEHPAETLLNGLALEAWQLKSYDLRQTLTAHMVLRGNGYGWILRDSLTGRPTGIRPLDPTATVTGYQIDRDTGERELIYATKIPVGRESMTLTLHGRDVLHLRGLCLSSDSNMGLDPLDALKDALGLGIAGQRLVAVQFENNNRPGMVITVPYRFKDQEAVEEFRARWGDIHSGLENAGRPAILESGATVSPVAITNRDTQLLESRQFDARQVSNIFGLPIYLLADPTTTSFASVEQMALSYRDELDPHLVQWEKESELKLLTADERATHVIEHSRHQLIRTDVKTQSDVLINEVNNGLVNVDEARSVKNLNPLPEGAGQAYRQPLNIGLVGQTVPLEEPAAGGEPPPDASDDRGGRRIGFTARSTDTTGRALQAAHNVLARQVRVSVAHIGHAAVRKSRDSRAFWRWLERIEEDYHHRLHDAIQPAVKVCDYLLHGSTQTASDHLARVMLGKMKRDLLDLAGQVTAEGLAGAVEEQFLQRADQTATALAGCYST